MLTYFLVSAGVNNMRYGSNVRKELSALKCFHHNAMKDHTVLV